jgi:hypothetical protein
MPEPLAILSTLPDLGRRAQFKMADCKPEVLKIPGMERHIADIPMVLPTFSTMYEPMVILLAV